MKKLLTLTLATALIAISTATAEDLAGCYEYTGKPIALPSGKSIGPDAGLYDVDGAKIRIVPKSAEITVENLTYKLSDIKPSVTGIRITTKPEGLPVMAVYSLASENIRRGVPFPPPEPGVYNVYVYSLDRNYQAEWFGHEAIKVLP